MQRLLRRRIRIRMGFLDKLISVLGLRKKEANVLVVGLDNSGTCTVVLLLLTVLTTLMEKSCYTVVQNYKSQPYRVKTLNLM